MQSYEFLDRTLFFPEKGILVIGDLHIGYDFMLRQSGVLLPERQIKDIIADLKKIFRQIKEKGWILRKIIFIGDIKHSFGFEFTEKNEFQEVMEFLGEILPEENIILIRGNHDTIDYTFEGLMKEFYIEEEIAFIHGDVYFPEAFEKKISLVVMGHIHPSVILAEKTGVKKESFKCFLEGEFKKKKILIMPSFLDFVEGFPVNEYLELYRDGFSIIPKKSLMNFRVHVIGKDKTYEFGSVKSLV